ncbi:hypothetical protein QTP86_023108 [Hemibagrus guttatus]|nr:hypothetical protein QTP86_023108 [Hemibagrus guttatus]
MRPRICESFPLARSSCVTDALQVTVCRSTALRHIKPSAGPATKDYTPRSGTTSTSVYHADGVGQIRSRYRRARVPLTVCVGARKAFISTQISAGRIRCVQADI